MARSGLTLHSPTIEERRISNAPGDRAAFERQELGEFLLSTKDSWALPCARSRISRDRDIIKKAG